jgi:hypothetical protein
LNGIVSTGEGVVAAGWRCEEVPVSDLFDKNGVVKCRESAKFLKE